MTYELTLRQADGLVGEVWSQLWLHRLVRSSWLAPPGHSLNGPAEFASLRSEYAGDVYSYRTVAKECAVCRVPGEHGGWR